MVNKWETEPDFLEYMIDEFHCVILRHPMFLSLCGYIGIHKSHPLYSVDTYNSEYDNPINDLYCHGGVTYTGNGIRFAKEGYWYVGFDCGHYQDLQPGMMKHFQEMESEMNILLPSSLLGRDEVYRDMEYVQNELAGLARQLNENEEIYQKNRLRYVYKK